MKRKRPVNRNEKIKSILLKSNNIQILSKKKSNFKCYCGVCGEVFNVNGYMNRTKFICPSCRKTKLAERRQEQRKLKRQEERENEYTSIKRKCQYFHRCLMSGEYLCNHCMVLEKPYYSKKEFIDVVNKANKSITIIGSYLDSQTPIDYKCNICGSVYKGKPYPLLHGECGCKKCHQSNGERIITLYLTENGYNFEAEKRFDDLRDRYPLRFDFYLPDYKIAIEYDGKQHFEPIAFYETQNAVDEFEGVKRRDAIKEKYCNENGIKLIRIRYDVKDIEEHLDEKLSEIIT